MRETSVAFLAQACGAKLLGCSSLMITGVKIDSREVCPGDLFVAVKGPNNDGHRFLNAAYEQGARAFLVSDEDAAEEFLNTREDAAIVLTDNTEYAFEMMAKGYLDQFELIRIAVSGSTGKTSTKALTAAVMAAKYRTVCSQKNYNTHLGIAMTCFLADETTQAIVIEMGMDRKDELLEYCRWVRPHAALLTNVGVVHMEYIGSREGIADEKLKITRFLTQEQPLVYNCDSPFLNKEEIVKRTGGNFRLVAAGEGEEALVKLSGAKEKGAEGICFDLTADGICQHFELPFLGLHNAHNGALAAAMGLQFGISLAMAAEAMPKASMEGKRLEVSRIGDAYMIDDSYNANPDSLASALRTLMSLQAKRRITVISQMRELGDAEEESHIMIGKLACDLGIDFVVAIGACREYYAEGIYRSQGTSTFLSFEDMESAKEALVSLIRKEDAVLVKGSFSTGICKLAAALKEHYAK
ncbi:MAG: UDP-N-acetylmuramoyl-tripeptide--D-alanyl-D-alanine ligase [Firmicutes bacterium]|nr:UDP-N-acetylmuramoyl-tripeptide--D-alanyl-D-alanine ligase [Bacillota bacterium]